MSQRNAGSAFIKVKPDATDFARDLRRDLRAVKDPGFVIDVRADTSQASVDVRRFRDVEQRNGIKMGVDVALGQAQADLAAFRARQRADGMTITVDADTGKARGEVASFRRQIESLGRSDAFRINLSMAGISLLPTAALGLAQVASAIQQVSQAGLALPGALGSATASVGTLLVGLSGIADAWKAADAAAESAGADQVAQARAAAAASTQLRNAVVDEVQARRDQAQAYRDARNQLEDLNVQMRGGLISESRAILEAQKAREDLARGNFSDIRDATLRIAEADQRVLEVRSRNQQTAEKLSDSNAKGIAQSDLVVTANERVVRAEQQTADAHLAVADAAGKQSAAQKKAADELAKLSPKAREFFEAARGLKPVLGDLKNTVQDIGFDGLAARLESTAQKLMPSLKSGLSTIAHGWNENFQQLFTSIGSDDGKTIIDRILGSTGDAQSRLTAAIDPLVKGLGTLTAAGSEAMPRVADAIGDVSERFNRFITDADKDGRLKKWIDDGLTGIGHLGETVLNLGKTWTAITKAAGGGALLANLESLTGKLQTFLNSTEGQEKLKKFFDDGRAMLDQWRPILEAIPGLFQGIYDGAKIHIGGVLTVMGPLVKLLSDHPTIVATAIAAWAGWKTLGPIVSGVQSTLSAFSTGLMNLGTGFAPVRDKAKSAMGDVDKVFVDAGKSGSGMGKWSKALAGLSTAGGPMMILGSVAVPALIGAMQLLDTQNQKSAEKTDYLNSRQKALEETLDRVTGKLTNQSRAALITEAQNYDPGGRGGGVPGISKGDALAAATRLGIAPDVYGNALVGDQSAQQQVMEVLKNNNLVPEFQQNGALSATAKGINDITQGEIGQDDLINALLNAPGAVAKYDEALSGARQRANGDQDTLRRIDEFYSLLSIAQRLSATGQASVLSGGALNTLAGRLPSGDTTRQANQANNGRWRLTPAGTGFFGGDFQVGSDNVSASVVIPAAALPALRGKLDQAGYTAAANADRSTVTIKVPLNSPYLERYETGGAVNSTPGPFAGGGKLAIVHPDEFVVSKRGRASVPDSFLHQLNAGHFSGGGMPLADPNWSQPTPTFPGSTNTTREGWPDQGRFLPPPAGARPGPGSGLTIPGFLTPGLGGMAGIGGGIGRIGGGARAVPHFWGGGEAVVDANGNPVDPGAAPGPAVGPPEPTQVAPVAPVAPNPTGGGVQSVLGHLAQGLGSVAGNAISLGSSLINMSQSQGQAGDAGGQDFGQTMAARAAGVPGLIGLFGSMSLSDPAAQQAALSSWGQQTANWTANWAVSNATKAVGILSGADGSGGGVLGALGLQNSILSSSNQWNQSISRAAEFGFSTDGPMAKMLGVSTGSSGGGGGLTDPSSLASQYGITIDPATGQLITSSMASDATLSPEFLKALYSTGHAGGMKPGVLVDLPSRGGEGGLQIDTINAKRAIEANFPEITQWSGYRQDALKWHPNGLAIDVMIPGQGGNNDPTTPEGLALGNRIYQYVMANKDALGVDYVMWQEKDHYNHLHVNTVGGGYPKMASGGAVRRYGIGGAAGTGGLPGGGALLPLPPIPGVVLPTPPSIGRPSSIPLAPSPSTTNSLGLGPTPNVNAAPGFQAGQNLTHLRAGVQGAAGNLVEGIASTISHPIEALKGMAPLIGAGGDGAPGVGESWKLLGKGITHWDEWKDNPWGAAGGAGVDLGSLLLPLGPVGKVGKAGGVPPRAPVDLPAVAGSSGINLTHYPQYLGHNIPVNPDHYYRSIGPISDLKQLFTTREGATGTMAGYGKGNNGDALSFMRGYPLADFVHQGNRQSNMIIEATPTLPVDAELSRHSRHARRSGGLYAMTRPLSQESIVSGEIPMRVWERMGDTHEWAPIFSSLPEDMQRSLMDRLLKRPGSALGSSILAKAAGGPIWGPGGPKSDLIPAWLSNGEFVQQVSAVDKYGLPFMHKLNAGLVDPAAVQRLADGGPPTGYVKPNPNLVVPTPPPAPKPNFTPGPGAMFKQLPQAIVPAQPTSPKPVVPTQVPDQSQAPAQTPVQSQKPVTQVAAPPESLNHNLPAVSKGISSAASAIGTAISTAMSLAAAGASAGGSAIAGPAIGAASSYAAGLATQGGKIVEDAANVVSSFLVGNVPGSNGDPNMPAYGDILNPQQNRPSTASYRRGGDTNNFYGHDAREVIQMKENHDSLKRQARLGFAAV